jgi:hypothetical protein
LVAPVTPQYRDGRQIKVNSFQLPVNESSSDPQHFCTYKRPYPLKISDDHPSAKNPFLEKTCTFTHEKPQKILRPLIAVMPSA